MRATSFARVILLPAVLELAGCSGKSTTAPKPTPSPTPSPTRFTVFASDRGRTTGYFRNFITGLDGSGTSGFVFGTGSAIVDRHPSITADGNLLVYQSAPGRGGSQDVFGYSRATDHFTDDANVNTNANESRPYTALDQLGQRMAFVSDRNGNPDVYLYQITTQTLTIVAAMASDSADIEPSISGNGRYVCFASTRAGGQGAYDLVLVDSSTGQLVALPGNSAASDRDPSISSDGMHIQFASDRPGGLGRMDLWLLDRANGTVQEVNGQNSAADDVDPVIVWN